MAIWVDSRQDIGVLTSVALLTCDDCGRDVSDRATACPHCGCPVGSPSGRWWATSTRVTESRGVLQGVKFGFGMFVVLPMLLFGTCAYSCNEILAGRSSSGGKWIVETSPYAAPTPLPAWPPS